MRNRYFDLLRAIAIVRVVVYHSTESAWMSIIFPSMGVMFALAGSLMARSLKRPAWSVIRGRTRGHGLNRVLPGSKRWHPARLDASGWEYA